MILHTSRAFVCVAVQGERNADICWRSLNNRANVRCTTNERKSTIRFALFFCRCRSAHADASATGRLVVADRYTGFFFWKNVFVSTQTDFFFSGLVLLTTTLTIHRIRQSIRYESYDSIGCLNRLSCVVAPRLVACRPPHRPSECARRRRTTRIRPVAVQRSSYAHDPPRFLVALDFGLLRFVW